MAGGQDDSRIEAMNREPEITFEGPLTAMEADAGNRPQDPDAQHAAKASAAEAAASLIWLRTAIGALATLATYAPIFPGLVHEWATFPSLSHGFAVPLIAGYLVWTRRREIASAAEAPSWLWLPLVAAGLALYVAGARGGEPFLARVSLPLTLLSGMALISGWAVARQMVAGIAYLFFMIPLPYVTLKELTDQMRLFDATATAGLLPLLGVPVFQEGYLLHLPNMTLEVADVCSSIPAIASFLALAAAYAYVNRRRPAVQAILIISAVPFGILSNIIRITTTGAGVYFIGPIAIHNVIHMWNGTTVFLMTLGFLIALDVALRRLWRETV
jgi:exosortase